jgi:hypothetical protein
MGKRAFGMDRRSFESMSQRVSTCQHRLGQGVTGIKQRCSRGEVVRHCSFGRCPSAEVMAGTQPMAPRRRRDRQRIVRRERHGPFQQFEGQALRRGSHPGQPDTRRSLGQ